MRSSGWSVDVQTCSEEILVEIIKQLRGSEHFSQQLEAQKELIRRARNKRGLTTEQIVKELTIGRSKYQQNEIAEEWAEALGITIQEFKRIFRAR